MPDLPSRKVSEPNYTAWCLRQARLTCANNLPTVMIYNWNSHKSKHYTTKHTVN